MSGLFGVFQVLSYPLTCFSFTTSKGSAGRRLSFVFYRWKIKGQRGDLPQVRVSRSKWILVFPDPEIVIFHITTAKWILDAAFMLLYPTIIIAQHLWDLVQTKPTASTELLTILMRSLGAWIDHTPRLSKPLYICINIDTYSNQTMVKSLITGRGKESWRK